MTTILNTRILKHAYSVGYFPMAESRYGHIYWHSPDPRAIFPIKSIKPSKSMRKKLKSGLFQYSINRNFNFVIQSCSEREETWINEEIIEVYAQLHLEGYAHSIEVWQNNEIVGGLYGIAIGAAFFGESMFNFVSDASKAAFYFLVHRLNILNFELLDSQYLNPFTAQLGAIEIKRDDYMKLLKSAISKQVIFT